MRRYGISGIICLLLIVADRLSKAWAVQALSAGSMQIIPGILSFQYAENDGAAFGMLGGMRLLNGLLTLLLLVLLCLFLFHHRKNAGIWYSGLIVISGGLSHLYDRMLGQNIIDFIRLDFIDFPIFNFADVCICAGTFLLAGAYLLADSETRREKQ